MKFNTKVRYGLRAMVEIAMAEQERGVFQKDIARNQDISVRYLDHIIASLKAAGLIRNVAGKNSGYRLNRSPEEITAYDIYQAFEYELEINECVGKDYRCERYKICPVRDFWTGLNELMVDYMQSHTLEDLREKQEILTSEV